ncbi:MAG: hypothetical protein GAK38_03684 [Xylophilus sp.]|nr:MAG: hypothetical protein GAK38_03684 [Xylophilus sp.]
MIVRDATRRLRAQLDQRIHRHAVEPGEQRQQRQVGQHAPVRGAREKAAQGIGRGRRRQRARGEVEVHREHAHADRAQRHQPDLDLPARQHFAQQRARADADREHHEQQRGDMLVAMQHVLREARELAQEHRAKEPHPADAEQRTEHHRIAVREPQVAPGLAGRVPVHAQVRVGGRRGRHRLRHRAARERQHHAGDGDRRVADARQRHQQAAGHVAEQDRDEGAHLDHAVAAGQLALVQHLRQVGELDRPEQCGMHAHEEHAAQQHRDLAGGEAPGGQQHDRDLQVLHEADQPRLVELVGQLPGRGREQQERQHEQRADHQPGHRRRQPGHLELVGDQHGERELEQVVVGRVGELRPEERSEAPLAQQGELVGVGVCRQVVEAAHRMSPGEGGRAAIVPWRTGQRRDCAEARPHRLQHGCIGGRTPDRQTVQTAAARKAASLRAAARTQARGALRRAGKRRYPLSLPSYPRQAPRHGSWNPRSRKAWASTWLRSPSRSGRWPGTRRPARGRPAACGRWNNA